MEKKIFMTLARCFYTGFVLAAILLALLALTIGCGKSPGHYETRPDQIQTVPTTPVSTQPPDSTCGEVRAFKSKSDQSCYVCGKVFLGCHHD